MISRAGSNNEPTQGQNQALDPPQQRLLGTPGWGTKPLLYRLSCPRTRPQTELATACV
jgi:hypothetical protein